MRHLDALKVLRQPVYIGIVSHGAKRLNDVCVSHKGKGNILLASFKKDHGELHKLADSLHQNEFPFEPVEDWRSIMREDRKSTRLNSSHVSISYAVVCLKKKNEIEMLHTGPGSAEG